MIYTIGHSTRTADAFVELLRVHEITQLADIRTVPRSRRHPHFSQDALAELLKSNGITYRHIAELGGRRTPKRDSINTAWQQSGFRGYADHMMTAEFERGVDTLLTFAQQGRTTVMCAESVWWQCHRRLLSDALVARGVAVCHILSAAAPKPHELSEFAQVHDARVIYPGLV